MNAAVILSGGNGSRMGADMPKQYMEVAGKPVLVYTIEQFQQCKAIDRIVVVAAEEWKPQVLEWSERFKLTKLRAIAPAGADRQGSILNGLLELQPFMNGEQDGVIIQDAVRPMTSGRLILELLEGLREAPAVMPALPMTDTVYYSRDGQWVDGPLDRSTIFAGQAPEAFRFWEYLKLYMETPPDKLSSMSGSCQLPYSAGWRVKMIPGEADNIKITYPADMEKFKRSILYGRTAAERKESN